MTSKLPWYDSQWLLRYLRSKEFLATRHPTRVEEFVAAFDPLRTRSSFRERLLDGAFDEAELALIRTVVQSVDPSQLEMHEVGSHGRLVVHDHPTLVELQSKLVPRVEELVEEAVEVSYNFLAFYTQRGFCRPHLDAPEAKWTLDLCIEQTEPWPIHFSDVVPWPERFRDTDAEWKGEVERHAFRSYAMEPGQALMFSGSSQWHYRDGFPGTDPRGSCTLLFFHFFPVGARELLDWESWERRFDAPGLGEVVGPYRDPASF
jgi:hypothetical protein